MRYQGVNGQLAVDGDDLLLLREGTKARAVFGAAPPRRIPLAAVSGVAFKPSSRLQSGTLQLHLGGQPGDPRLSGSDPDAVTFSYSQEPQFAQLRDWLLGVVAHNRQQGIDPSQIVYDTGSNLRQRVAGRVVTTSAAARGTFDATRAVAGNAAAGLSERAARAQDEQQRREHVNVEQLVELGVVPAAAPAAPLADLASQIGRLAELHAAGALSDEEFAILKSRLLA